MTAANPRTELGLAAVLILAALALDLFWVRPATERLARAAARAAEAYPPAPAPRAGAPAVGGAPGSGTTAASQRGPVEILETALARRGLLQRELRLLDRRDLGPVRETYYYLDVHGDFTDVFGFLKDLESGAGRVAVSRFRMVTASGDPGVTLFLWASVLSPTA